MRASYERKSGEGKRGNEKNQKDYHQLTDGRETSSALGSQQLKQLISSIFI
jgi:hypothetical protein